MSYRPASLCSLATQFQTRFLELIPRPIAGLKFSALYFVVLQVYMYGTLCLSPFLKIYINFGKFVILRYDKISSQNMHCKHKKIRQKTTAENLPKQFGAGNPRNCLCSLEQQQTCKKSPRLFISTPQVLHRWCPLLHHIKEAHPLPDKAFLILPPLRP